jgi:hypothetical protein
LLKINVLGDFISFGTCMTGRKAKLDAAVEFSNRTNAGLAHG